MQFSTLVHTHLRIKILHTHMQFSIIHTHLRIKFNAHTHAFSPSSTHTCGLTIHISQRCSHTLVNHLSLLTQSNLCLHTHVNHHIIITSLQIIQLTQNSHPHESIFEFSTPHSQLIVIHNYHQHNSIQVRVLP